MAKNQLLQTTVSEEVYNKLKQEADSIGLSLSAYTRSLIMSRTQSPIGNLTNTITTKEHKEHEDSAIS